MSEGPTTCRAVLKEAISVQQCMYVSGWDSTADLVEISIADASTSAKMPVIGLTVESSGSIGDIIDMVLFGEWIGPADFVPGTTVYVNSSGVLASSPGTVPQKIGVVMKQSATEGRVLVFGCGEDS